MSHRSTTLPLYFWEKWTCLPLFYASSITSFLFLTFVSCHARIFSSFSIIFPRLPLHPVFLMLEASEETRVPHCSGSMNLFPLQRCDLHDTFAVLLPIVFSQIRSQTYLVLCFPILLQVSPRQFTDVLQGIAGGIVISNFVRAFFMDCLNSSSSGSMKKIPR